MRFIRKFNLCRWRDVSGVSGTGLVAEGWELWPNGPAIVHWLTAPFQTWVLHPKGVESVIGIHGHGGSTELVWP